MDRKFPTKMLFLYRATRATNCSTATMCWIESNREHSEVFIFVNLLTRQTDRQVGNSELFVVSFVNYNELFVGQTWDDKVCFILPD